MAAARTTLPLIFRSSLKNTTSTTTATSSAILSSVARSSFSTTSNCSQVAASTTINDAADPSTGRTRKRGFLKRLETMPFQTYQLALEVIAKDREEKRRQVAFERERLQRALAVPGVSQQARHVLSLRRHIEKLKIQADINNPRVRYNFQNGIMSLSKPIYRFLLERKWRARARPILMQRIQQLKLVPDVIPNLDPIVDVQLRFRGRDVKPGTILPTLRTERFPTLKVIPFKPGEKLLTIAVVDPDVPDVENDSYTYRLHWLVSNIVCSPTQTQAIGTGSVRSDTIVPYLPPYVQRGIPYHRLCVIVLEQTEGRIDPEALQGKINRDGFNTRSLMTKQKLTPIGATMWRNKWDAGTREVMERHGIPGWDVMWQRVKG